MSYDSNICVRRCYVLSNMSVQRPRGPVQYVGPHEDDPMVARKYDVRSKFQEHSKDRGFVNHMREEGRLG